MKAPVRTTLFWIIAVAALAAFGIFFWGSGRGKEEKYRIIFIPKVIDEDNDFWKLLIEGVEMAAAENDMDLVIVAPETEDDYKEQNAMIEWAIAQKPSAILLAGQLYGNDSLCKRNRGERNSADIGGFRDRRGYCGYGDHDG